MAQVIFKDWDWSPTNNKGEYCSEEVGRDRPKWRFQDTVNADMKRFSLDTNRGEKRQLLDSHVIALD